MAIAWAKHCGISPDDERAVYANECGWPEKFEYFKAGWDAKKEDEQAPEVPTPDDYIYGRYWDTSCKDN